MKNSSYTPSTWDDVHLKIVFAIMYNRGIKRLNDWCSDGNDLFEARLRDFNKYNKNYKATPAAAHQSKTIAYQLHQLTDILISHYAFADYLSRWNSFKSILPFANLLMRQRNFFSHGFHRPIRWQQDEQDALKALLQKVVQVKKDKVRTSVNDLFCNNQASAKGILTFQGALFFISLFLTSQDVNEMMDGLEEMTDLYYRNEKSQGMKTYSILNYNASRVIYTFWAKRGKSVLTPDLIETKKFYDLVSYLRRCPKEAKRDANAKLIEKYGMRESDRFLYFVFQYFQDLGIFDRMVFETHSKDRSSPIYNNNIEFSIYDTREQNGTKLKGYMGVEIMERILVRLFNGDLKPEDIENMLERFILYYHDTSVEEIDMNLYPMPRKIRMRRTVPVEGIEMAEDRAIVRRLEWILNKIESSDKHVVNASEKADFIADRWNRWQLFHSIKESMPGLSPFPRDQFLKIRSLLTNYKAKRDAIIEELKSSRRYGGEIYELCESSFTLDELYEHTLQLVTTFCSGYLLNKERRTNDKDALHRFLSIKTPFTKNGIRQFSKPVPTPIHKRLFEGKNTLEHPHLLLELIDEYYPVEEKQYLTESLEKKAPVKDPVASRYNKKIWKLRQKDKLLGCIASKYLQKILHQRSRALGVIHFSIKNLDEELARLAINISFSVLPSGNLNGGAKQLIFSFDEYKVATNRMVLDHLSDLVFLPIFDGMSEIRFGDFQPEIRNYLDSQYECIERILKLEAYVFQRTPTLKSSSSAQKRGYLPFADFIKQVPQLKAQFDQFISGNAAVVVDTTRPFYDQQWIKFYRNAALHTNLPKFDGQLATDYFKECIDFIDQYLSSMP